MRLPRRWVAPNDVERTTPSGSRASIPRMPNRPNSGPQPRTAKELESPPDDEHHRSRLLAGQTLHAIAQRSGGRSFTVVPDETFSGLLKQFIKTFEDLESDLTAQYTIGFDWPYSEPPKTIRIRTVKSQHVRTRQ